MVKRKFKQIEKNSEKSDIRKREQFRTMKKAS